jgi:hypothetical protein
VTKPRVYSSADGRIKLAWEKGEELLSREEAATLRDALIVALAPYRALVKDPIEVCRRRHCHHSRNVHNPGGCSAARCLCGEFIEQS